MIRVGYWETLKYLTFTVLVKKIYHLVRFELAYEFVLPGVISLRFDHSDRFEFVDEYILPGVMR